MGLRDDHDGHYMMHMHQGPSSGICVCTALRKASRAISRVYDSALSAHGLSTVQYAILRHIARAEPVALSRLARDLVTDRTALYRALAPLEAKGWVTVEPGLGKSRRASLTARGGSLLSSAQADWEAVQARVVGTLGPEQWASLQTQLHDLAAFTEQSEL